ncbi:MAG: GNAT family protein [Clostridia bacterium]|nr:GNAT family protein [Clostridia bacterium]
MPSTIQLRQEIFASDAWKIAEWLENHKITAYLNEGQKVSETIKQSIYRVNMPILTHLFNRNGSFFMVINEGQPIGFLRLVVNGDMSEIVVVIGDIKNWGRGFGHKAICQGLEYAFFTLRNKRVIAKIHIENERSERIFKKIGFREEKNLVKETQFYISQEQYLKLG